MDIVFSTKWFEKHQQKLLWLLNNSYTKRWFRYCLRIRQHDCKLDVPINRILPNSFSYGARIIGDKIEVTTDFRTHDKYSKRLYYAFKPLWYILHIIDWVAFDRYEELTKLSFGFSTLTQYPWSIGTDNPVNERVARVGISETWSVIIAGAGNNASSIDETNFCFMRCSNGVNTFDFVGRSIFCFDTSALTSGATISATVMSLYGSSKSDAFTTPAAPNLDIYTSTPAATNATAVGDYNQIGTTSQTGSPISYASFSTTAYNDFTFDATGRGNVSKTGISKFGARNANHDVANSSPTWNSGNPGAGLTGFYAMKTGTTNDPKLVVTYSVIVGPANLKTYNTNLSANIKTINTNPIANVKTLDTNA